MAIKTTENPTPSQKCWEFNLTYKSGKSIKTFVYSDTGKDIEERFLNCKVTNIKKIPDPLKDSGSTGWKPKGYAYK